MRHALALVFALLAGCNPSDEEVLAVRIAERVAQGEGAVVDMVSLTPFVWDRLYVVGPYTTEEWFEQYSGVDWPLWKQWSSIEMRDDRVFLVFVREGEVVSAFDYLRRDGAFEPSVSAPRRDEPFGPEGLTPTEARFVVHQMEGWPALTPVASEDR